MTKISVAVATYNEEKNIGKCLSSVADWVSEIVMVDGSSTDKTVEIAKKFKAKVIITDNPPIFHINKQKAIDACTGDWILQLDEDEIVNRELKDEILEVIQRPSNCHPEFISGSSKMLKQVQHDKKNQSINGYWIPRKNFFLGRFLMKGGQYPDYALRLYKKGKGHLPCKSVHEQAIVSGKVGYLKNPLQHFPYENFSEYLEHFRRYTDIFAREYKEGSLGINPVSFINYLLIKPIHWFLLSYLRHKGFMDGCPGLVFSFFSSLRFPVSFIKYLLNK